MLRPIFIDNTNGLLTLVGLIFILIGCNQPETKLVDHSIEKSEAEIQQSTSLSAELAYLTQAKLGEGALWNHKTQTLWWIDIEGMQFNIYDPKTNKNRIHPTKTRIGTVVPSTDGNAILATEEGIAFILFLSLSDIYCLTQDSLFIIWTKVPSSTDINLSFEFRSELIF